MFFADKNHTCFLVGEWTHPHVFLPFLARLDEVQEELLYCPRRRHRRWRRRRLRRRR